MIVKYENIAFESNTCATVDTNPENVNFLMDVDFVPLAGSIDQLEYNL